MSNIIRQEPPAKTITAYKVFAVFENDPGHLYPPMVANPSGMSTPVGVWLNASTGEVKREKDGSITTNSFGRMQVKPGGPGTNKPSTQSLAWRPGWHLGEWPDATQFAVTNPETGKKEVFPANFVFCECEIAATEDYQIPAMEYGMSPKGSFNRTQAGLPYVPEDGYYRYRTNAMPGTAPWYITGIMKVTKILDDEDRRRICAEYGKPTLPRLGGDIDLAKFGLKAGPVEPTPQCELDKLPDIVDHSDEIKKLPGYVRRPLNFDSLALQKEFAIDHIPAEKVAEYKANYVPPMDVSVVIMAKNRHNETRKGTAKKNKSLQLV